MPQSLSAVYLHLIFSTKNRIPFLQDLEFRSNTHTYMAGISNQMDCPAIIVGGVEDHVHLLARQSRIVKPSDWVKEIKRVSCNWIKDRDSSLREFKWQSGYGIFSVSPSKLNSVERYIADQEEHHRTKTFQDEYREFLKQHSLTWDEQHVWD